MPKRRHSSLPLKLSRTRRNDVGITGDDDISRQKLTFCGADKPSILVPDVCTSSEDVEIVFATLDFPCLKSRQGLSAQDPLSSVHYYLICMFVALPVICGLRMCLNCPHCNVDKNDPSVRSKVVCGCQDVLGRSTKPLDQTDLAEY